jgi:hypothetical protein
MEGLRTANERVKTFYLNIGGQCHSFLFIIFQIGNETSTFCIQKLCLRIVWWCGREVVWKLACLELN